MFQKFLFFLLICTAANEISAQTNKSPQPDLVYINVFIAADKTIYVETEKTEYQEVSQHISAIVGKLPFRIDQKVIFRIFADENLDHGYIMDVNSQMGLGYRDVHQTLKYLLNTVELNIDGQNWFKSIDLQKLESKPE